MLDLDFGKRTSKLTARRHQQAHPDPGVVQDIIEAVGALPATVVEVRAELFRKAAPPYEGAHPGPAASRPGWQSRRGADQC